MSDRNDPPWGAPREPQGEPPREPMFNAPWPPLLLAGVILAGYALQGLAPGEAIFARYGFSPAGLAQGRYETLVTALFLSGGWAHALTNAAGALAFGTPVARVFGLRGEGAVAFFLFYLVCGALSSLGFALVHPGGQTLLVGASGAVSGLMAATARILGGRGRMGPVISPPVLGMGAAWIVVNLIIAVLGFAPGMGDGAVAWEAHLFGFAAGLLLAGPFAWLASRHITD